jgi:hypothetical protein
MWPTIGGKMSWASIGAAREPPVLTYL